MAVNLSIIVSAYHIEMFTVVYTAAKCHFFAQQIVRVVSA